MIQLLQMTLRIFLMHIRTKKGWESGLAQEIFHQIIQINLFLTTASKLQLHGLTIKKY